MLKGWSKFEKEWLFGFVLLWIVLSFVWQSTFLTVLSYFTGIICVILIAKGSLWNYPVGLVQSISYGLISLQSLLYGEAILNFAYFIPIQLLGWILWNKHMDADTKEVKKRKLSKISLILWLAGTIIFIFLYNNFLKWIGSAQPFFSSITTSLSIIAKLLMVIRSKYQWLVWALVNIISIIIWIKAGGYLMSVLFASYLTNNLYGWKKWSNVNK